MLSSAAKVGGTSAVGVQATALQSGQTMMMQRLCKVSLLYKWRFMAVQLLHSLDLSIPVGKLVSWQHGLTTLSSMLCGNLYLGVLQV
jgi:hypothetical protein